MALPSNAVLLEEGLVNICRQFEEDRRKKASITDTDRYNQWVNYLNSLNTVGAFEPALTPAAAMDYTNGIWADRGFAGIDALIIAQEPNWSVPNWPIPFA